MSEDDKKGEILKAIEGAEARLGGKIDGMRQHKDVNLDAIAADTKAIRRAVEWLKTKWEKFTREPM
jgi:hypothetical protein